MSTGAGADEEEPVPAEATMGRHSAGEPESPSTDQPDGGPSVAQNAFPLHYEYGRVPLSGRDQIDQEDMRERAKLARRGQIFGFVSLMLTLSAVVWLGLAGHDWLAAGIFGSAMVSTIGLFVTGRYRSP